MSHLVQVIQLRDRIWVPYLEHEKTGVEVARVDENGTELAALEELIGVLEEDVVGIDHDNTLIVNQAPCIELVQCELEPPVHPSKVALIRILQVLHHHHPHAILLPPAPVYHHDTMSHFVSH